MDKLFLKPQYLKMLLEIFQNYCPKATIWVYGSRIKGEAHEGSDLDLVVKNFNDNEKNLYTLKQLLNDSNIPILIDINEFDHLPKSFQEEIKRKYISIFN